MNWLMSWLWSETVNSSQNKVCAQYIWICYLIESYYLHPTIHTTHAHPCSWTWVSQLHLDSPSPFVPNLCILSGPTKAFYILSTILPCPSQTDEDIGRGDVEGRSMKDDWCRALWLDALSVTSQCWKHSLAFLQPPIDSFYISSPTSVPNIILLSLYKIHCSLFSTALLDMTCWCSKSVYSVHL